MTVCMFSGKRGRADRTVLRIRLIRVHKCSCWLEIRSLSRPSIKDDSLSYKKVFPRNSPYSDEGQVTRVCLLLIRSITLTFTSTFVVGFHSFFQMGIIDQIPSLFQSENIFWFYCVVILWGISLDSVQAKLFISSQVARQSHGLTLKHDNIFLRFLHSSARCIICSANLTTFSYGV